MSVFAAGIAVAVRIPISFLSDELLMIAPPPHVDCANIICPPTRFEFCVLSAAAGSTGCDDAT